MTQSFRVAVLLVWMCLGTLTGYAQDKGPKSEPDILIFSNGDQLRGTLLRSVGQNIVFKSDMAGEITVSLDKVKELRTHGSFAVLRKNVPLSEQRVEPGALAVLGGSVTVAANTGRDTSIAAKDVGFIVDKKTYEQDISAKPRIYQGWNGSVTAGATIQRSTQNGSTYTAGIALIRAVPLVSFIPPRNRTTADFTETYGKITQPTIPQTNPPTPISIAETSIFHADAERDEYASPRFYILAETAFDHNFSQGLNLQQIYGFGVGWTPIQQPGRQLDLKIDGHYEKQQFQTGAGNQNLIGSLFAENYRRTLPRKLVLTQTLSVLPAWNNLNAYSANGSVVLAAPVFRRLSMTVTTTDNFLNNPAAGYRKNSFQFVTGIGYTLR